MFISPWQSLQTDNTACGGNAFMATKHSYVFMYRAQYFCPVLTNSGLSTDFNGSPQYQISPKSVQWEPRQYIRTEGHNEPNRPFRDFPNTPQTEQRVALQFVCFAKQHFGDDLWRMIRSRHALRIVPAK